MKTIGRYALLMLALGFGLLPAGRSVTMLAGGCDAVCCQACSAGCCSEHTSPLQMTCPNCNCSLTEFAIQIVYPVEIKQAIDQIGQHDCALFLIASLSQSASVAASRSEQNRLQRSPDLPLFLKTHVLLV